MNSVDFRLLAEASATAALLWAGYTVYHKVDEKLVYICQKILSIQTHDESTSMRMCRLEGALANRHIVVLGNIQGLSTTQENGPQVA